MSQPRRKLSRPLRIHEHGRRGDSGAEPRDRVPQGRGLQTALPCSETLIACEDISSFCRSGLVVWRSGVPQRRPAPTAAVEKEAPPERAAAAPEVAVTRADRRVPGGARVASPARAVAGPVGPAPPARSRRRQRSVPQVSAPVHSATLRRPAAMANESGCAETVPTSPALGASRAVRPGRPEVPGPAGTEAKVARPVVARRDRAVPRRNPVVRACALASAR
jgi:hypothetical protein